MLGIISNLIVVAIVATLFVILVNSASIAYLVRLLDFFDKRYITGLVIASILGILALGFTFLAMFLQIWPIVIESTGLLAFFFATYKLAKKYYTQQSRNELLSFALFMSLFAFGLNFLVYFVLTAVINALTIA